MERSKEMIEVAAKAICTANEKETNKDWLSLTEESKDAYTEEALVALHYALPLLSSEPPSQETIDITAQAIWAEREMGHGDDWFYLRDERRNPYLLQASAALKAILSL